MRLVGGLHHRYEQVAAKRVRIRFLARTGVGIYILFDGSMPMYVGKGRIKRRIIRATVGRRSQLWDHFSWYAIKNAKMMHDIEVLMLRILPPNWGSLTRQGGNFRKGMGIRQGNKQAVWISRKGDPPK
jgi:hypothetical protein